MVKLFFNQNATEQQVLFNFELRGYKVSESQENNPDFMRLIIPGKWPNEEILLYYNRKNEYYWVNLNKAEHEKFLCSRDVDLQKSIEIYSKEIATQTD